MINKFISDQVIVITGASSGAGRVIALELAKYGGPLVLAGRNTAVLEEVAAECKESGAEVLIVATDVTDSAAMVHLAEKANEWKQRIDVWINNAGVLAAGDFDKIPMDVNARVINTNLLGYMNGVHAVLPIFKRQQYGIIINNISIGGYLSVPYGAGYSASKFGLRGFSEALKGELAGWKDIHVCDLHPGFLDTPGIQHAANYTGKVLKPAPPVYDPKQLAIATIDVIRNPKSSLYVGGASMLLKAVHAIVPELTSKIAGAIMRRYFKKADNIATTNGNLFETVDYNMSGSGGFPVVKASNIKRDYLAIGILAGVAIGLYLFGRPKKQVKAAM